jgi:localization factor PodJL
LVVPQDMVEAYRWFAVAARSVIRILQAPRHHSGRHGAPDDLAKGEAAAEAFQPLPLVAEANDVLLPEGGWGEDAPQLQSQTDYCRSGAAALADKGYDPGPADASWARRPSRRSPNPGSRRTRVDRHDRRGLVAALQEEAIQLGAVATFRI